MIFPVINPFWAVDNFRALWAKEGVTMSDEKQHNDPIGVTREWLNEYAANMGMEPDDLLEQMNMDYPTVVVGLVYFKPTL